MDPVNVFTMAIVTYTAGGMVFSIIWAVVFNIWPGRKV